MASASVTLKIDVREVNLVRVALESYRDELGELLKEARLKPAQSQYSRDERQAMHADVDVLNRILSVLT